MQTLNSDNENILVLAEKKINLGHFNEAENLLNNFKSNYGPELRHKNHLFGKLLSSHEKYDEAAMQYQNTISNFGPHINLLCDLLYSYVRSGQNLSAIQTIKRIKMELLMANHHLHANSIANTYLSLASICFELMEFREAIDCYNNIIIMKENNLLNGSAADQSYIVQAKIALLQCLSFLNFPFEDWRLLYNEVNSFFIDDPNLKLKQLKSLLIADSRHAGITKSQLRLSDFIKDDELSQRDGIQGIAELIESSLLEFGILKTKETFTLLNDFLQLKAKSTFEVILAKILLKSTISFEVISFCLFEIKKLNPFDKFRIYNILIALSPQPDYLFEFRRRREMLRQSLSNENQAIIHYFINMNLGLFSAEELALNELASKEVNHFLIIKEKNKLSVNGEEKGILVNNISEFLFSFFENETNISLEDLTRMIWGADYNESFFKQIWSAIRRLNSSLSTALKGAELFTLRKEGVYLNQCCKIIVKTNSN